ncbi:MAG TPA: hypothetical protein VM183_15030, partial [Burkholderiales bacterium]|nr:hypothetical protein [Burkholderiales bacterium]
ARFAATIPAPEGDVVRLRTARGSIVIGTQNAISNLLGVAPPAPGIAGYSLACSDPEALAARCRKAGCKVSGNAVTLPPALGGVWLLKR